MENFINREWSPSNGVADPQKKDSRVVDGCESTHTVPPHRAVVHASVASSSLPFALPLASFIASAASFNDWLYQPVKEIWYILRGLREDFDKILCNILVFLVYECRCLASVAGAPGAPLTKHKRIRGGV